MKVTIVGKMAVLFGVLISAFIGFCIFINFGMTEFKEDLQHYSYVQKEIKLAKEMQLRTANVWQFFTDASLTKDKKVIDEEAKPNYVAAQKVIDRIIDMEKDDKAHIENLKKIKVELDHVWNVGNKMVDAYIADWNKGNAVMDEFDKAAEKLINDVNAYTENEDLAGETALSEMFGMVSKYSKIALSILVLTIIGGGVGGYIVWGLRNNVTRPVEELSKAAERIAAGDLSVTITHKSEDEIGLLAKSMIGMVENLRQLIRELTESSSTLASASHELSATAHQLERGTNEQTGRSEQIATSVTEMTQTSIDIAKNATNIAGSAESLSKIATAGAQIVNQSIEGVKEISSTVDASAKHISGLGDMSKQIGEIVNVIKDIADQTNLLALNAAIEAARAGEQGRGFAVVADEVRKLAERTGKATSEISEMIGAIQTEVNNAVGSMDTASLKVSKGVDDVTKAGNALRDIVNSVGELQSMVHQIATATEEMSAVADAIQTDIDSVSGVCHETSACSSQMAESADNLAKISSSLQQSASKFRV